MKANKFQIKSKRLILIEKIKHLYIKKINCFSDFSCFNYIIAKLLKILNNKKKRNCVSYFSAIIIIIIKMGANK